jgi:sulfur-carrier protein
MVRVKFTRHLQRFFPNLHEIEEVEGHTVAEIVAALDARHPGLAGYILDDQGALRKHVNIFLGRELILDRQQLKDPVAKDEQVFIFQALSGGCLWIESTG